MNDLTPRFGHVVAMSRLPACDLCGALASWDAPMRKGPWAYMCTPCHDRHALYPGKTGIGIGQRLVEAEPEPAPMTVGAVLKHKERRAP